MVLEITAPRVDELTNVEDTASWDRQRTSEELKSFVKERIGALAARKAEEDSDDFDLGL